MAFSKVVKITITSMVASILCLFAVSLSGCPSFYPPVGDEDKYDGNITLPIIYFSGTEQETKAYDLVCHHLLLVEAQKQLNEEINTLIQITQKDKRTTDMDNKLKSMPAEESAKLISDSEARLYILGDTAQELRIEYSATLTQLIDIMPLTDVRYRVRDYYFLRYLSSGVDVFNKFSRIIVTGVKEKTDAD